MIESTIKKDDFTIDCMGRIIILDNEELLGMVSGGETNTEIYGEMKSSLFDSFLLELGNCGNCSCTGGNSGSGTGSGSGSGSGYCGHYGQL